MGRAPCCSKVGLHRGPWTAREDMLLTKFIIAHGEGQWRDLPKKAGLLRCGKSCRLRWMNYLRPDIKRGNITPDEEELIIRMHRLLGNRWSLIAGRLPGRTDNEIKNFWNTHLSKKLMKKGIDPKTHQHLSKRDDAEKSTGVGQNVERYTRKKKDVDSDRKNLSEGHVQQVHLPKVNRYIAFPRSQSTPDLASLGIRIGLNNGLDVQHANDILLSSSIDLNSSCSMSSLNSSQDSDHSSPRMLSHLGPMEALGPQDILPEQDNHLQDCFAWPCIEEEDWTVSNFQPTEGGSPIPNSCSVEVNPKDDDAKCVVGDNGISSISGNNYDPSESKLSHMDSSKPEKSSNVLLQKVYEEYLGLLQEDLGPNNIDNNNYENLISETPNRNGEDIRALPEGLSSVWDCLQEDDELLNQENDGSEPLPLH